MGMDEFEPPPYLLLPPPKIYAPTMIYLIPTTLTSTRYFSPLPSPYFI
jgi:hypothetical protein